MRNTVTNNVGKSHDPTAGAAAAAPSLVRLLSSSVLLVLTSVFAASAQISQPPPFPTISGSVPAGPATGDVRHLTLREAIDMALRYNLGAVESGENIRAVHGQRLQALSALLPQVSAGFSHNAAQVTSASLGFMSPFIPPVIGPFGYSTVVANVNQIVLNVESIRRYRAAQAAEQAASLTNDDTLDLVTLSVGNAYLLVIDTAARIDASEAQVQSARALYGQAVDAFEAGTSPRIDVTRTSVQLHTEQVNLTVARNNQAIAKLNLARAIGLPLGQAFDLADPLPYVDLAPRSVDEALRTAYASRSDFRAAQRAVESAQQQHEAARAQRYPALAVNGEFGRQGPAWFNGTHNIFAVQTAVNVPIFTSGRIESALTQAEAALQERQAEAENLRGQIDYDVRTALLNLEAAREQVAVAGENVNLAAENLARARERFAAGVTDSVEVVQAQQSVSSANDQYNTGVYSHNLAKLQLARAMGVSRTSYSQYLPGRP
jgi:outer membrane protein TolC